MLDWAGASAQSKTARDVNCDYKRAQMLTVGAQHFCGERNAEQRVVGEEEDDEQEYAEDLWIVRPKQRCRDATPALLNARMAVR